MARFYSYAKPRLTDVPQQVLRVLENLPDSCHVFLQFQIGTAADIDFMLLHQSGIHVVEVKTKLGAVHGSVEDAEWTIGSHRFANPYRQARRYAQALADFIKRHHQVLFAERSTPFDLYRMRVFAHALFT